jgi:hypothetical protein
MVPELDCQSHTLIHICRVSREAGWCTANWRSACPLPSYFFRLVERQFRRRAVLEVGRLFWRPGQIKTSLLKAGEAYLRCRAIFQVG